MRQAQTETGDRSRRRAATILITTVVAVGALSGGTAAQAAPRDNWQNARKCLQGGWRTLKTLDGRSFRGVGQCVIYAMRGGQFAPAATSTPPAPPAPVPPTTPPSTGGE